MEFKELIEARRSVRAYVPAEMARAELEAIVADALEAPSWKNTETARYYAALAPDAVADLRAALPGFNVASTANAAAYVAVTFRTGESGAGFAEGVPEEMWGAYDCGIASAYFVLAAKNRGWDSLILGIRDEPAIRSLFAIPADEILTSVIALGTAAAAPRKPRRKPVAEVLKVRT